MTLKSQIDRFSQNEDNFNALITGSAGTTVDLGEAGIVKSVATVIGEIAPGVDRGSWATTTAYVINDIVLESGAYYRCRENHTSGTFATDLAAGKWRLNQGGDSTILTHRGRTLDDVIIARFDNVTQMIADVNLVIGDYVATYANQNGTAVVQQWKIVAAATGTDDGGSYIDLSGSGLQAEQIFGSTEIDLKQFGAKYNDASFDNAIPFAAAFAYCYNGSIRPTGADTFIGQRYKLVISSDGSAGSYLNFTTACVLTQQWYDIEFRDYVLIKQHATFPANTPLFGGYGHVASFGGKGVVDSSVWRMLDVDNLNADMGKFEYHGLSHKATTKGFRFVGASSLVNMYNLQFDKCKEFFDVSADAVVWKESWYTQGVIADNYQGSVQICAGVNGARFENIIGVPTAQTATEVAHINAGRIRSGTGVPYLTTDLDIPTGYHGTPLGVECNGLYLDNYRNGAEPGSQCAINWATPANTVALDLGSKCSIINSNLSSVNPSGISCCVRFFEMPNTLVFKDNCGGKNTDTVFRKASTATFTYSIQNLFSFFNYDVQQIGEFNPLGWFSSNDLLKYFYKDIRESTSSTATEYLYDLQEYATIPNSGMLEVVWSARPENTVSEYRSCGMDIVVWAVGDNSGTKCKIEKALIVKSSLAKSTDLSFVPVFSHKSTGTEVTEIALADMANYWIRLKIISFGTGGSGQETKIRVRDLFSSNYLTPKFTSSIFSI